MQGSVRYEKGSPLILRGLVAKWRLRKRLQRVVGGGGGGGGGGGVARTCDQDHAHIGIL